MTENGGKRPGGVLLEQPAALSITELGFFGGLVDELPGFEVEWKADLGKNADPGQVLKDIRGFYKKSKASVFSLFLPSDTHVLHSNTSITRSKTGGKTVSRLSRFNEPLILKKKGESREENGVIIRHESKEILALVDDTGDPQEDEASSGTGQIKIKREKSFIAVKSSKSNRVFTIAVDERKQENESGVWQPLPKRVQIEYKGTDKKKKGDRVSAFVVPDQEKLANEIAQEIATIRNQVLKFIPLT